VIGSLGAILCLGPLLLATAVLIWLEDRGPIFFYQQRVGKDGKPFTMIKFRSMRVDAEKVRAELEEENEHEVAVTFKIKKDPRITKVGRWIRKFSVDEMPQFFNVLRGDMSMVGPRPALYKEVALYEGFQLRRVDVKPGISCLWQVQGRSDIDFEGQVRLDLEYIHSESLWQDIVILFKTVPAVILARGAY
jgi:lipopolysaccharide/colanic/teichoic acid biosynthesis glycosyltransferase